MEIKDKELHRIVTTTIIYRDDGKYLITRRSLEKRAFPGKWTVPGGGLNVDDYINEPPTNASGLWYNSLEKNIRREIQEEVGLEIGKPEYLLDITLILPGGIPEIILSYYAPFISGEVTYDVDTIDHAWVTPAEAKTYDMIEGIAEEIEMVEQRLNK